MSKYNLDLYRSLHRKSPCRKFMANSDRRILIIDRESTDAFVPVRLFEVI
jgi:hypothetical protein